MHGTPNDFHAAARGPAAITKERARMRFAAAADRAYARLRLDARIAGKIPMESPLQGWPSAKVWRGGAL